MGSRCTRGDDDEGEIRTKFSVGKDYQEFQDQFSGEGCKKTPAWKATITRSQLEARREEFWRTRTTGRRHVWLTIKQAVEADHETAKLLLEMAEITLQNGILTVCQDSTGGVYEIPAFVINDPIAYGPEPAKKALPKKELVFEEVNIKLRRMGVEKDFCVEIHTEKTVAELKERYAQEEGLDPSSIRLFFGGKEMDSAQNIASYYVKSQMVVQVLIRKLE